MNQEIKALWVKDLRENPDKQGKRRLRIDDKYCCLGRLCNLYQQVTGRGKWVEVPRESTLIPGQYNFSLGCGLDNAILPNEVMEWAGLPDANPYIESKTRTLASLNDYGHSFAQIADIVEKHL